MADHLECQTVSIWIDRDFEETYDFLADPQNWTEWASGLASGLTRDGDHWLAATPEGEMQVRFTPRNDFGIADHLVVPPSGQEIYLPMRAIRNGTGTEVAFTLFRQPGMDDEKFQADAEWVLKDLKTLKELLERSP